MADLPDTHAIDESLALLHDGYAYGARRFRELDADAYRTRLLGRPTVVMHGREASEVFYDGERMSRAGAIPPPIMHLLQDEGSVQSLEGAAHHHRKAVFLRMLDEDGSSGLGSDFADAWAIARRTLSGRTLSLYDVGTRVLTRAALTWTGVPSDGVDIDRLAGRLAAMVDDAPRLGPVNWAARLRRRRVERWATDLIARQRSGPAPAPADTPLGVLASARDVDGALLSPEVAAVELINLLRPIVAIARYLAFSAHALERHPDWRERLRADARARHAFAQEVRRWYPFFPAIVGTVARPFAWHGHDFRAGERAMLDLYATNHDPREWREPERFDPSRFLGEPADPNALVPQGGGDAATGHRCPGEGATLAVMETFLELAAADPPPYDVPAQDARISLRKLPALPVDRMRVTFRA
ncbi:cytochrome P450 [Agromyces sp. G08B096]|uniref:Cytochrome P450 n=1 Tax=Agromyces sp. G08B096 TaxID=3156399 RepID=A0AAU7W6E2_9MICO